MSEHTHEHTHEHEHEHDHHHHDHHHDHEVPETRDKMITLLDYNCRHNESHASELKRLADKLKDQGHDAEAAKVAEACEAFDKGNAALRQALELLKRD